jgi:glycosyltransferase involved in cell wall biosynthesis
VKIVQITPGSGDNFYCENCLRDAALVTAMHKLEHDVILLPMYLPLQVDTKELPPEAPIFFGGINVYLQQKLSIFRKTPRWLDRLFDSPSLLEWASHKAGMTSAKDLAQTTISMLQGRHGRQIKELDRLIEWLARDENKPNIVILSNILLIGLAGPIKERLGAKIVCLLQDEDGFLDGLMSPYTKKAWALVTQHSKDVDLFISVSEYYANLMQQKLHLDKELLEVVHMGISQDGYRPRGGMPDVPTIGYLSRMCPERGLDTLVDAFIQIKKNERLKNTRLRIAGGKSASDEPFLEKISLKLGSHGLTDDVEFLPSFERASKLEFLHSLSVLSVPEKQPVAYGLYVLEALASGVPVVEPAIGVFPELVDITGGGVLYQDNTADGLATAIQPFLLDPNYAHKLGQKGRDAILEKFRIDHTAEKMIRIFERIIQ